nr:hypothetical protein [Phycisphaeraceae bacterium]
MESGAQQVALDTLKFSHNEWISVVEHIKRISSGAPPESGDRRHYGRAEALGLLQIVIEVTQPGGTNLRLLARSHDLSVRGLGFIHGMYLHPDSPCICWMRHVAKGITPIAGSIRWCRHITGRIHLSGVNLDEEIRISDYLVCESDEETAA